MLIKPNKWTPEYAESIVEFGNLNTELELRAILAEWEASTWHIPICKEYNTALCLGLDTFYMMQFSDDNIYEFRDGNIDKLCAKCLAMVEVKNRVG